MNFLTDEIVKKAEQHSILLYEGSMETLREDAVHLLNPSREEMRLALEDAIKNGKKEIYVYQGRHFSGV